MFQQLFLLLVLVGFGVFGLATLWVSVWSRGERPAARAPEIVAAVRPDSRDLWPPEAGRG